MAALKHSRQRDCIKKFVQDCTSHPTADDVYTGIKEEFPHISLGTVYRNLALLVELGELKKIATENGPDRFDATLHPHTHFVCTNCHGIEDIELNDIDHILEEASENFSGKITSQTTIFYGFCKHCLEEKNLSNTT